MHGLGYVFCLVLDVVFMRQIGQGLGCVSCLVLDMFFTRQIVHGAWLCILSCMGYGFFMKQIVQGLG